MSIVLIGVIVGYFIYFAVNGVMTRNICTTDQCVVIKGDWKKVDLVSGPKVLSIYKKNIFGGMEDGIDIYPIEKGSVLPKILDAAFKPLYVTPLGAVGSIDDNNPAIKEKNYSGLFDGKLYIPGKRVLISCQKKSCLDDIVDIRSKDD
ncbi:hypothetical protein [Paracidovorax avenae]|uniref:hypothetical protein n=1 Tax=Paracidovorax avenae TaxID=80867 RepID=UPI0012FD2447|nr:hypothetical protein [Paracidovorax avenae]